MKVKAKNTLREMARYLGIQVKFVSYLADDVHGKLIPREKRVLINASKPRTEHIFTLLHELGHFVLHYQNFPRKYHPWYLEIHWKNKFLAKQSSFARRCLRFYFKNTRIAAVFF